MLGFSLRRFRHVTHPLAASLALFTMIFAPVVQAGPQGAQVINGNVVFTQNGNVYIIHASNKSIINYSSFNIASNETVQFIQPHELSRVLNRIDGAMPTQIDGNLLANGIVYLVNPAGVIFGNGSTVDVGGIYAAAADISNQRFLNNINKFTNANGSIINNGHIHGDFVHLLGDTVANHGTIVSEGGIVTMLAGNDILIGKQGGRIHVRVDGQKLNDARQPAHGQTDPNLQATPGVENTGVVQADHGSVFVGAGDLYALAVRNTGTIQASKGEIAVAALDGAIHNQGLLTTSTDRGAAGSINVKGPTIVNEGEISADSNRGRAGSVEVTSQDHTYLLDGSVISAAGGSKRAHGGDVLVHSYHGLTFMADNAFVDVSGGAKGGRGGFAEISGKWLHFRGDVNLKSKHGFQRGHLLLDPRDITVTSGVNAELNEGEPYPYISADGVIAFDTPLDVLEDIVLHPGVLEDINGDITLQATRDIFINSEINLNNFDVLLEAYRNIIFNAAINGAKNLTAHADWDVNEDGVLVFNVPLAISGIGDFIGREIYLNADLSGKELIFQGPSILLKNVNLTGLDLVEFQNTLVSQSDGAYGLNIISPLTELKANIGAPSTGRLAYLQTDAGASHITRLGGDVYVLGNMTFGDAVELNRTGNQSLTATLGRIWAKSTVNKIHNGNLTLAASDGVGNTYDVLLDGTVNVHEENLIIENGFQAKGNLLANNDITLNGKGLLNGNATQTINAQAGTLTAHSTLTKAGAGDLILDGATAIHLNETVDVDSRDLFINGNFDAAGDLVAKRNVVLEGDATLNGAIDQLIHAEDGTLTAQGTLTKSNGGDLTLDANLIELAKNVAVEDSGDLNIQGGLIANENLLADGDISVQGAAGQNSTIAGNVTALSGSIWFQQNATLGGNVTAGMNVTFADDVVFNGAGGQLQTVSAINTLWAQATLTKTTAGDLALKASTLVDLDGNVDVQDGSLTIEGAAQIAAASIAADQDITFTNAVTFNGQNANANQTVTAGQQLDAQSTLAKSTNGNLNLTGDDVYLEAVTLANSNGDLNINGFNSVHLNGAATVANGNFTSIGGDFENQSGAITAQEIVIDHNGSVTVHADMLATNDELFIRAGSDGTGNLTFGSGGVNLHSNSMTFIAGDSAGAGSTAYADFLTNAPMFFGSAAVAGGNISPINFTWHQDASITNALTAAGAQFGSGTTQGVNYALRSWNGSIIIDDATKFELAKLHLIAGNHIDLNAAFDGIHLDTLHATADTLSAGGFINLNNGVLRTDGSQWYQTAVRLLVDSQLYSGSTIHFVNTVNTANFVPDKSLFVNAQDSTTFGDHVGMVKTLKNLEALGVVYIAGNVLASSVITLHDAAVLNGEDSFGNQVLDAGAGTLWAMSTVEKLTPGNLTLAGSVDIKLDDDVYVDAGSLIVEDVFHAKADLVAQQNITLMKAGFFEGDADQLIHAVAGNLVANSTLTKTGVGSNDDLSLHSGGTMNLASDVLVAGSAQHLFIDAESGLTASGNLTAQQDLIITVLSGGTQLNANIDQLIDAVDGNLTVNSAIVKSGAGNNDNLTLHSGGAMDLNGDVTVDASAQDLFINADDGLTASGNLVAQDNLTLTVLNGNTQLDGNLDQLIDAVDGNLTVNSAIVKSGAGNNDNLTLHSGGAMDLNGDVTVDASAQDLFINADDGLTASGNLVAQDNLTLTVLNGNTQFDGNIDQLIDAVDGNLTVNSAIVKSGAGNNDNLTMESGGSMDLNGDVTVDASAQDLFINAQGGFTASGDLFAHRNLKLTVPSSNAEMDGNQDQQINAVNGSLAINTATLIKSGLGGDDDLTLHSGAGMDLDGNVEVNSHDLFVNADNGFTMAGNFYAQHSVQLNIDNLSNPAAEGVFDGGDPQAVSAVNGTLTSNAILHKLAPGALLLEGGAGITLNKDVAVDAGDLAVFNNLFFNGHTIDTSGKQTYFGSVNLGADAIFTSSGQGQIHFHDVVNGLFDLQVDTGGTTIFDAAVSLAVLHTNGGGATHINGGLVVTSGNQLYDDAVLLGDNTLMDAQNVFFNNTLDSKFGSAFNLTVNATLTSFNGQVGNATGGALGTLLTDSNGITTINTDVVNAASIKLNDDVLIGADTTLTGTDNVNFAKSINSQLGEANDLTINSLNTNFNGQVGNVTALKNLTTDESGITTINTDVINAVSINLNDDVLINVDTTLTGTDSVNFGKTINSQSGEANDLTINSPNTHFNGEVGGEQAFGSLTTTGAADIYADITAEEVSIGGKAEIFNDVTLVGTGLVNFEGEVLGAHDLIIKSTGANGQALFAAKVDVQSLKVNATKLIQFDGSVTTQDGLKAVTDGDLLFSKKVLGHINAHAGNLVDFQGRIGDANNRKNVIVTAGGNAIFAKRIEANSITVNADGTMSFGVEGGGSIKVLTNGAIRLNFNQNNQSVPQHATIIARDDIRFESSDGDFVMGQNEKLTSLGSLTIVAKNASIGDLNSQGNMQVDVGDGTLRILQREDTDLNGDDDLGVDFVSGGTIEFFFGIPLDQHGQPLSEDGLPELYLSSLSTAPLPTFAPREGIRGAFFNNEPVTSVKNQSFSFLEIGNVHPNELELKASDGTVLDLRADGPSQTNLADSFARGIVLEGGGGRIAPDAAALSAASKEFLRELNIEVRDWPQPQRPVEKISRKSGKVFEDVSAIRVGSTDQHGVALPRMHAPHVEQARQLYLTILDKESQIHQVFISAWEEYAKVDEAKTDEERALGFRRYVNEMPPETETAQIVAEVRELLRVISLIGINDWEGLSPRNSIIEKVTPEGGWGDVFKVLFAEEHQLQANAS